MRWAAPWCWRIQGQPGFAHAPALLGSLSSRASVLPEFIHVHAPQRSTARPRLNGLPRRS